MSKKSKTERRGSPDKKTYNLYMEMEVVEAVKENLGEGESFSGLVNEMLKRRLQGLDTDESLLMSYGDNLIDIGELLVSKGEDLKEKGRK